MLQEFTGTFTAEVCRKLNKCDAGGGGGGASLTGINYRHMQRQRTVVKRQGWSSYICGLWVQSNDFSHHSY